MDENDGSSDDSSDAEYSVVGEKRSELDNAADGIAQQGSRSLDSASAAQKAEPSILSREQHTLIVHACVCQNSQEAPIHGST